MSARDPLKSPSQEHKRKIVRREWEWDGKHSIRIQWKQLNTKMPINEIKQQHWNVTKNDLFYRNKSEHTFIIIIIHSVLLLLLLLLLFSFTFVCHRCIWINSTNFSVFWRSCNSSTCHCVYINFAPWGNIQLYFHCMLSFFLSSVWTYSPVGFSSAMHTFWSQDTSIHNCKRMNFQAFVISFKLCRVNSLLLVVIHIFLLLSYRKWKQWKSLRCTEKFTIFGGFFSSEKW